MTAHDICCFTGLFIDYGATKEVHYQVPVAPHIRPSEWGTRRSFVVYWKRAAD